MEGYEPLRARAFPCCNFGSISEKCRILNKNWGTHSMQSYLYILAELEDCEGSHEEYTSLHTQQREERQRY